MSQLLSHADGTSRGIPKTHDVTVLFEFGKAIFKGYRKRVSQMLSHAEGIPKAHDVAIHYKL